MVTNIDIDQEKIEAIMSIKKFKSKKELVDTALDEFLKNISRQEVLKWKGSDFWEGDLNKMRQD